MNLSLEKYPKLMPSLKRRSSRFLELIMEIDILGMASSVAYYTVLSLTPFLLLFFATIAAVGWQDIPKINAGVSEIMGPGASVVLESLQHRLKSDSGSLAFGIFGLFTLIFSASGVIAQLQYSLDTILCAKNEPKPAGPAKPPSFGNSAFGVWLKARLFAIFALVFCIFVASVSLVLSVVVEMVFPIQDQRFWNLVNRVAVIAIFALIFTMMFRYLPNKIRSSWKMCIKGGVICSLLFHLGKGALAMYFAKAGFESSYGALSSFVVFLLWAYYNAAIILFSAVIAQSFFGDSPRKGKPLELKTT